MKLSNENYKDVLKGISVVEVSGEGCANCITLMPILARLVGGRSDCQLHHLEVAEDTMDLVAKFGVDRVPTILVMQDLEVKSSCRGYQPEEILEIWLDAKIEELKA